MGALSWLNAELVERVLTHLFGRLVRCPPMGTLSGDYSSSILDMLKNMVFRVRCTWRSNCFTVQICVFTVSLNTKQQYNIQMQIADMYNTKPCFACTGTFSSA